MNSPKELSTLIKLRANKVVELESISLPKAKEARELLDEAVKAAQAMPEDVEAYMQNLREQKLKGLMPTRG